MNEATVGPTPVSTPTCAFCPACNPRRIAPSPSRVLAPLHHRVLGEAIHFARDARSLATPIHRAVWGPLLARVGRANLSRQLSGRSFIALVKAGAGRMAAVLGHPKQPCSR